MMKRKPGRPRGTKNKIKTVVLSDTNNRKDPISDFQKTLNEWDKMEKEKLLYLLNSYKNKQNCNSSNKAN